METPTPTELETDSQSEWHTNSETRHYWDLHATYNGTYKTNILLNGPLMQTGTLSRQIIF